MPIAPPIHGPKHQYLADWRQPGLALCLIVLMVAGCTTQSAAEGDSPDTLSPTADVSPPSSPQPDLAQYLPIGAIATLPTGEQIQLEVAETPQQQSLGLMYRDPLPDDRGMVFPFTPPRPVSFWMKNVPVALDMVFIYQGKVKAVATSAPPCNALPCPTYGPGPEPIDFVIELRSGRAAELGIVAGEPIEVTRLETPISPDPEATPQEGKQ